MGAGDGSRRGLRSLSAWPAASGLGWLSAPPRSGRVSGRPCGFPGCVERRLGAGCGASFSFCSVLAALVFSSPPSRRVYHPCRLRVCLCVGGIPGDTGVTVTPAQAAAAALSLAPHLRGRLGSKWRGPSRGDREGRTAATPNLPGEGLPLAAPALCCLGLCASPSLPPRARSVRLGGGDEATTPPSRFPWKPRGWGYGPSPPPAGLGELRGPLGADSPLYLARSLPQTHTSAPRPARVWQGVESTQVRDSGFPTTVRAPSRS